MRDLPSGEGFGGASGRARAAAATAARRAGASSRRPSRRTHPGGNAPRSAVSICVPSGTSSVAAAATTTGRGRGRGGGVRRETTTRRRGAARPDAAGATLVARAAIVRRRRARARARRRPTSAVLRRGGARARLSPARSVWHYVFPREPNHQMLEWLSATAPTAMNAMNADRRRSDQRRRRPRSKPTVASAVADRGGVDMIRNLRARYRYTRMRSQSSTTGLARARARFEIVRSDRQPQRQDLERYPVGDKSKYLRYDRGEQQRPRHRRAHTQPRETPRASTSGFVAPAPRVAYGLIALPARPERRGATRARRARAYAGATSNEAAVRGRGVQPFPPESNSARGLARGTPRRRRRARPGARATRYEDTAQVRRASPRGLGRIARRAPVAMRRRDAASRRRARPVARRSLFPSARLRPARAPYGRFRRPRVLGEALRAHRASNGGVVFERAFRRAAPHPSSPRLHYPSKRQAVIPPVTVRPPGFFMRARARNRTAPARSRARAPARRAARDRPLPEPPGDAL